MGGFEDALESCQDRMDDFDEANGRVDRAGEQLAEARASYDEAGGFWDDSTAWDGSLVVGEIVLCASGVGTALCIVGGIGAGLGILASEGDRQDEISSAEEALQNAELQLEMAEDLAGARWEKWWDCMVHALSKGGEE